MYLELNDRYSTRLSQRYINHEDMLVPVAGRETRKLIRQAYLQGVDPTSLVETAVISGNLYVWSDMHFNHKNIILHAKRDFDNMEDMGAQMLAAYLATISPEDVVIFGGDISMGHQDQISKTLSDIKQLPGRKILIRGNHDKSDMTKLLDTFEYVCAAFTFRTSDALIDCTHYPIPVLQGRINLHGHTHQHLISKHHINMSVEHTGYAPVLFDQLRKIQGSTPSPATMETLK